MALVQRLKNLQVQANVEPLDLSHLQLEDLRQEKIAFGQKHHGKSFESVWNSDQVWITWVLQHYGSSTKGAHRKLVRYVELVERAEQQGNRILVKEDQPEVSTKGFGKSYQAKPKSQPTRPIETTPILEEARADEEDSFEMVANQLAQNQQPDVQHLEARMLNLENALQRVISHLEDQALRQQEKPAAQ